MITEKQIWAFFDFQAAEIVKYAENTVFFYDFTVEINQKGDILTKIDEADDNNSIQEFYKTMDKKVSKTKTVPKRLRQTAESAAQRGLFFTDRSRNSQSDFSPRYMTVANDIIKRIFDGEYRPASKLPSMRVLAKKYGCSVQVILSAFQGLQSLNYIVSYPKRGVFVSSDIRPARFYRIAVFVLNQNPFTYGDILYHLNDELEKAGYSVIIGMNFDGGLTLRHWLSFKRNLDGLIILGTLTDKQENQFRRIKIPYMPMVSAPCPKVTDNIEAEIRTFAKWFLEEYIDAPPESRPMYLCAGADGKPQEPVGEWAAYNPDQLYIWDGKNTIVRKTAENK